MFPVLQIGSFAIQLPGLFLILGLWLGTLLIDRVAPRHKVPADVLNNMVFYSLIAGIAGARLGYAFRFPSVYLEDPLSLISLNTFTLSLPDGLLVAGLVALVYGNRIGLPLWSTLDALTPSMALLTIFVALAHLSNGDAFGSPSNLPWAVELWGTRRHPSQIYELIAAGLLLLYSWRIHMKFLFPGFAFLSWIALYAGSRLFLEAFRGDSQILFGSVRSAQLISLAVILTALYILHVLARREESEA